MEPKAVFKQLQFFFWTMLLFIAAFLIYVFYIVRSAGPPVNLNPDQHLQLKILMIVLVILAIVISNALYKRIAKQSAPAPEAKLFNYRKACLIKLSAVEFSTFTCEVILLLTADLLILAPVLLLIFLFILQKPAKEKFFSDFNIADTEKDHFA